MSAEICSHCGGASTADLSTAGGSAYLSVLRATCFTFLLSRWDERLAACLDGLERPAAIVGDDYAVLLPNRRLGPGVRMEPGELRIGEVIGCARAASPGCCGEGPGCVHCGVRKAIDHTFATGEKVYRYPVAFPTRSGAEQALAIITMRAADGVVAIFEPCQA